MIDEVILYVIKVWEGKPSKGDTNDYRANATLKLLLVFTLSCEDFLKWQRVTGQGTWLGGAV